MGQISAVVARNAKKNKKNKKLKGEPENEGRH